VDQATGDVYVVDRGNGRVEKFSAVGAYLSQFDGSEAPEGPFLNPSAVAVDNDPASPSYGEVYVADSGHNTVDKFTSEGVYVPGSQLTGQPPKGTHGMGGEVSEGEAFSDPDGLAVDPTSGPTGGDLYVSDNENKLVDIFTSAGEWSGQFSFAGVKPWSLAVNTNSDVYVAGAGGAGRVIEYTPLGESELRLFSELNGGFGHVRTMGVDLENNNIFLGTEVNSVYQLEEVNSSGELTTQHNFGGGGSMSAPGTASPGIAVDSASGTIYAVDAGNDVVDIFGLVVLPGVTTGGSSEVKGTTATVAGLVDPEGVEAGFFFEYGPCNENAVSGCPASLYSSRTAEEPVGSVEKSVEGSLTGMAPETVYHYRLVAKNVNGENPGQEGIFTTGPAVAGLATIAASGLTPAGATLNGLLDPEGTLTHYYFQYGLTSEYGEPPTEPGERSGLAQEPVSATITGLEPGTIYHYRVVAENGHGIAYGNDETLTTRPVPPTVDDQAPYATEIALHEATLHGTVNPGKGVTEYHFAYGPAAGDYTQSAPVAYTPLNYEDDQVQQLITGLEPDHIYHYVLIATNASGTITGPDETFSTISSNAPAVQTGEASELSSTGVTLSGAINPEERPVSYIFELGSSASSYGTRVYGSLSPGTGPESVVSTVIGGLIPGRTYHYRLVAASVAGTTFGADRTFATPSQAGALSGPLAPLLVPTPVFPAVETGTVVTKGSVKKHKRVKRKRAVRKKARGRRARHARAGGLSRVDKRDGRAGR
jgi:hypothetical protein